MGGYSLQSVYGLPQGRPQGLLVRAAVPLLAHGRGDVAAAGPPFAEQFPLLGGGGMEADGAFAGSPLPGADGVQLVFTLLAAGGRLTLGAAGGNGFATDGAVQGRDFDGFGNHC